jgi:hypothetical protein
MQTFPILLTFLPYYSFTKSLQCLDDKRLGKQRVEAMQILNALEPGSASRWRNHPAVKMWKGWEKALHLYKDLAMIEWRDRGFNNAMALTFGGLPNSEVEYPSWLTPEFCAAHRSNLLRKDPVFYGRYGWTEPRNLPYIWPKAKEG